MAKGGSAQALFTELAGLLKEGRYEEAIPITQRSMPTASRD